MTSDAPGWDAIDAALAPLYPGVEPKHFGTIIKWMLGGPDPLDGVSFYPRDEPVPHWHVVSYGMSELYAPEDELTDESGWGFEFTFRVRRDPAETEPPMWAASPLQNLGRYVFQTGNWFEAGHHMDLNGPIMQGRHTLIRAIAFAADPELGTIDTPNGTVTFLQVVGITPDEYAAIQAWTTPGVLDLAAERLPLLVTDLDRASLTDDPAVAAAVEAGRRRDGSSTGSLAVGNIRLVHFGTGMRLTVGAHVAERLASTLTGRLPYGNPLVVSGPDATVAFRPGDTFAVIDGQPAELVLPPEALDALIGVLIPSAGTRQVPGTPLVVEIARSEITDQDGTVIETIG